MTNPTPSPQFAICVRNEGYPASLERRKLYQMLPDEAAAAEGLVRIVDESGDDYLYPQDYFVLAELPPALTAALLQTA
jgi:hypothetical protein